MTDLADRYGQRSGTARVVAAVLIAGLVLSSVGFVGWAAVFHGSAEVQSRLTAYDVSQQHEATARLTVVRDTETTIATCVLQAVSDDHALVGQQTITVTTGPTTQAVEVRIPTERKATTVTTDGCTSDGQDRPR